MRKDEEQVRVISNKEDKKEKEGTLERRGGREKVEKKVEYEKN